MADSCAAMKPHLEFVEYGQGASSDASPKMGLGEDECRVIKAPDIFDNRVVCKWTNTAERTWTADDARDIGVQLHNSCRFLTLHYSGPRHEDADYFLWYGDFTGVSIDHNAKGLELVIQIDEEAYYFS